MTATATAKAEHNPWIRETIDSFGVALILAFLFRAFIAEAFVIPTGSMAPTLMGAHKDVFCSQCKFPYQAGASEEFNNETGSLSQYFVYETTCPICKFQQPIQIDKDANQKTFSGDRILVSKLAYIQGDPERWQVIVFKNPTQARQNYIKRLVGLPNEKIHIEHGDVYVQKEGEPNYVIARKAPRTAEAMLQPVSDTNHRSKTMIEAGIPSPWQPHGSIPNTSYQEANTSSAWKVTNTQDAWKAECATSPAVATDNESIANYDWLRYYHYTLKPWQWYELESSGKLKKEVLPRSSQLITDFSHYNATAITGRSEFYNAKGYRADVKILRNPFGLELKGAVRSDSGLSTDGAHWVGDLACELELDLSNNSGSVVVDLVEAGVHHLLEIDAATGNAQLRVIASDQTQSLFDNETAAPANIATAKSNLRGNASAKVKFANIDDTLFVWIDGEVLDFSPSSKLITPAPFNLSAHRPQFSAEDPGDAAPVGIAFTNGLTGAVVRASIMRDIYYSALDNTMNRRIDNSNQAQLIDYTNFRDDLRSSITGETIKQFSATLPPEVSDRALRDDYGSSLMMRDILFGSPDLWNKSALFTNRGSVEFVMDDNHYFPLGDNSSKSQDARLWGYDHYVHRDLLIGRAVLVFWPHHWNSPIPFWPNFQRFGIIR